MKTTSVRATSAFQKCSAFVAVAIIAMSMFFGISQSAVAGGQCCVNVAAGAAARTSPEVGDNLAGWVISEYAHARHAQKSDVVCYADGGWATGLYKSNRWFKVWVTIATGSGTKTDYYYVHSSYVTNQIRVPAC